MPREAAPIAELKHKRFAREVVKNGGNGTLAYQKVYPLASSAAAATSASRLLKADEIVKIEVQDYQRKIAEKCGPDLIAKTLSGLTRAKKKVWYDGVQIGTDADHAARNAAVKIVLASQGVFDQDGKSLQGAPVIHFNFIQAPSVDNPPVLDVPKDNT